MSKATYTFRTLQDLQYYIKNNGTALFATKNVAVDRDDDAPDEPKSWEFLPKEANPFAIVKVFLFTSHNGLPDNEVFYIKVPIAPDDEPFMAINKAEEYISANHNSKGLAFINPSRIVYFKTKSE